MIYLIDGSNLLGRSKEERESVESKRALLRGLSSFAHRKKAKVVCFFDGPPPSAFATRLGSISVVFSAPRPADDLIKARAEQETGPVCVVTSDQTLAARVRGRRVEVMATAQFAREMAGDERGRGEQPDADDWDRYFSDPKNRNI